METGVIIGICIVIAAVVFAILSFVFSGLFLIRDNEVGVLTKKMFGKKMPEGQIIARAGEIGMQASILMPGLYWRIPFIWKCHKEHVTTIDPNQIGCIESVDGLPLPIGRVLADEIPCNSYQDAKAFLDGGGIKGPQVAILRPGTYRINLFAFNVTKANATAIPEGKIGIVTALDGIPLPPGYIVAPKSTQAEINHRFYQDGQAFIAGGGYRGPQLDTLQPGQYYINPLFFLVVQRDVADVPPGYVAVLRSNVGMELEKSPVTPSPVQEPPDFKQPIHEDIETLLIADRGVRGIWREPVAPGKYNLNYVAFTPYLVPTSAVTIDWASGMESRSEHIQPPDIASSIKAIDAAADKKSTDKATEFFRFSQLRVTSMDGFQLEVDVRMIIRIRPEHAAFVIARFGSVHNLIEQIVHPLIDASFRNKAGEKKAIEFVQSRTALQVEALDHARKEFQQYHVEAQNLLIAYIAVDKNLLDTQTKKEIALQQQDQYKEEAAAEQERIQVEERRARANKQPDVVSAALSIEIEENKAKAVIKTAEGVRESTKIKADGQAYENRETIKGRADGMAYEARETGKGVADAYRLQAEVVGPERLALLKIMDAVGSGKIKITPDVLVGAGDGANSLFNAWLATMLNQGPKAKTEAKTEK